MFHLRRLATTAAAASIALTFAVVPAASGAANALTVAKTQAAAVVKTQAAASVATGLPQPLAAREAAQWLAARLTPQGYIPLEPGPGADLSSTAQSILALAAANVDLSGARTALSYLAAHTNQYVTQDGADGPGQLALLILDAEALGANPKSFDGTNLVTRLLATKQTTGPDAGLFGTETQAADYSAGSYQQGLALAALAAVGVRSGAEVGSAIAWLKAEQCPDGGWTTPDNVNNACNGLPADFAGPDTNSTSLAVDGLAAQGALTPAASAGALGFLTSGQDSDGGWSYYANTLASPGVTDPDSTSLVIQALLALGQSPTAAAFAKGTGSPVTALLAFQFTSGPDAGAFFYPPALAPASIIASYQAVPALAALTFPFGPSGQGYWLAAADGGVFGFGDAHFYGSAGGYHLNQPVVGIATTPDGKGYWLVAADGGVFGFGDAHFYGSAGGYHLNQPVVGIATTPDGKGYWLVAADGGVFGFGDAHFYGSAGGYHLNQPVVGIATTPDGKGYWLVAADGGVFGFGDAHFYGSAGGYHLNQPVVGIATTPDGKGYWLVAADGGVFGFGDAHFYGSAGGYHLNQPVVGIATTPDGKGYWLVAADGGVFGFGDAHFYGSAGGYHLNQPVVGLALSLARPA